MNWHDKDYTAAINAFNSDEKRGLTLSQADAGLEKYGKNSIEHSEGPGILMRFFAQFNDFMVIILLIAAGVSAGISLIENSSEYLDTVVILLIILINAVLGVVQEYKAEKALNALKDLSAPKSRVIRGSKMFTVETETLVPGDIIILKAGDMVPADARLIEAVNMKAEESALTGESHPVEKDADIKAYADAPLGDRHNMVFAGTIVNGGRGKAVVVATGMYTEMGRIAGLIINDDAPDTPLQKKLGETGKILGLGAVGICAVIFLIGLTRNIAPLDMFMISVSLAVAAIPEGLPAIVTIMLAIGVQRMAKKQAVIRKLPAVETLGSATVICSDKTGTLTQNKMRVVEIRGKGGVLPLQDNDRKSILKHACLCNDTVVETKSDSLTLQGEPTESAIVSAAYEAFISKNDLDNESPRVMEIPFDSKRKLMSTVHKQKDDYILITKGAPDILINKCGYYFSSGNMAYMDTDAKKDFVEHNNIMASKALRVLGVAYKKLDGLPANSADIENDLVFLGLIGIIDPPRPEVLGAVTVCKRAGIRPVMVTGDHIITAKAIAQKLGIMEHTQKAITGVELNKLSQGELENIIDDYTVFARVSPEHKVRIVKAFQARGNVVAMTGDGINDAPALKSADIGCAMGITGTDVAKGAADMILMDDNFATIVDAVKEGRGIYSNIKKAIHFLLSSNIGEIITIFVAMLLGWEMPLIAIQLLWVNLITDSLPAIALGLDPADMDSMLRKPYKSGKSFFADGLWQSIILEGAMIGLLALIAFGFGKHYFDANGAYNTARSMCFATLSISQLVHAFNMRSDKSLFTINPFENKYLVGAFFVGLILQIGVISIPGLGGIFKTSPLNNVQWLVVMVLCLMPIVIVELEKMVSRVGNGVGEEDKAVKRELRQA
ncbi:MAG: calcium-translocating P-type ATPase, PMCA-type [Clostridiales bacterium]|jgi:Ca2+-transporting ATPase|nr:calcium-translocating P-type ATPase, PMCA-type [Clostridiales bacterium]